jgi:hypothetical protein
MCTLSEWLCCSDSIPHELQWKGDVECYNKVMGQRPNYPKIWWYNLVLAFKKRLKNISRDETIFEF